jgi:quercetin dioxygenase-like cupin family protein
MKPNQSQKKMKEIQLVKTFELNASLESVKNKEVKEIFNGFRRRLLEIKLINNEVLTKHKAAEPITVFCLSGKGIFHAGKDLQDEQKLQPGTLITLEAGVEHELSAEPELHLLITKFKE